MILRVFGLIIVTLLIALPGVADIVDARGEAQSRLGLTGPQRVTVIWTLTFEDLDGVPDRGTTILSPELEVRIAGATPQFIPDAIIENQTGRRTQRIRETVILPPDTARHAADTTGEIEIIRTFETGRFSATAVASVRLRGGMSGEAAVEAVDLQFEDGSDYAALTQDQSLRAEAQLRLSGITHRITGVWEYAPIESERFEPVFQPFGTVSQNPRRQRSIRLLSPPVPPELAGPALVRLRLTTPESFEIVPVLSYFVEPDGERSVATISLTRPLNEGRLKKGENLSWRINKASTQTGFLRLHISAVNGDEVMKILLPPSATDVLINPVHVATLIPGETYNWHLEHVNENGWVVGRSQFSTFLFRN